MTGDLMDFAKMAIEKIATDFTKPDDDFTPTLFIKMHNGDNVICGLDGDFNSQRDKDEVAKFMLASIACARATEVAFVSSAWAVKYPREEGDTEKDWKKIEARDDFVMPSQHPERVEVVNVMHASLNGDVMASAEIIRHETNAPRLGEWEEIGGEGATLGGRFGDAIHSGLEVGQNMAGPDAPPEMVRLMDEMIADGNFDQLVKLFMNGAQQAAVRRN